MRISSRSALRVLIALALTVVVFFGVRAELTMEQRSSSQFWQMAAGLRADADLYCYERQADGCWSPAEIDEHDERIVARKE